MKNLLIPIIIIWLITQYSHAQNYREVFDFNINDVFEYQTSGNEGDDVCFRFITTEKYKIINKEVNGDTIKYSITGKRLKHSYVQCFYYEEPFNHHYYLSDIVSTLVFIDSVNNFLNKPVGSLIPLLIPYGEELVLTRVLVDSSNGLKKKVIGGSRLDENTNFFEFSNDTNNLIPINSMFTSTYKLSYSKNLGLVEEDYWGFEYGYYKILEGYIIDNDTTGIINPDNKFTNISEISLNKIKIYPNPVREYLCFDIVESKDFKDIVIIDMTGREIIHSHFINKLFIGDLRKGIYIIKIIEANNLLTTYKFIKD